MALMRLEQIQKHFGHLVALDRVGLSVEPGEVLGLAGDNGAGKSTLIKIMSGAITADAGRILIGDQVVRFDSPRDARRFGIETVYQDLALCGNLNVAKNLCLGREPTKRWLGIPLLDEGAIHKKAKRLLESLQINIPSTYTKVKYLSAGQRQAVAISRSIYVEPKILIADEPTSALASAEVRQLLDLFRLLKTRGTAIIFVSQRLQDIIEIADRIAILQKGRKVAEVQPNDLPLAELANLIAKRSSFEGSLE